MRRSRATKRRSAAWTRRSNHCVFRRPWLVFRGFHRRPSTGTIDPGCLRSGETWVEYLQLVSTSRMTGLYVSPITVPTLDQLFELRSQSSGTIGPGEKFFTSMTVDFTKPDYEAVVGAPPICTSASSSTTSGRRGPTRLRACQKYDRSPRRGAYTSTPPYRSSRSRSGGTSR